MWYHNNGLGVMVLRKLFYAVWTIIGIMIIIVFIVVGIGLWRVVTPPEFKVTSLGIVDDNGYPAIRIVFETDKYPITFKLLAPQGKEIYTYIATKGEKLVHLHLTPLAPYTNVIGPQKYVVKVFYMESELASLDITVEGVKPVIRIVSIETKPLFADLLVEKLFVKIRNDGDAPLYISDIPKNIKVFFDDEEVVCAVNETVITPGEEKAVTIKSTISIPANTLDREHVITVAVGGARAKFMIPKLALEINAIEYNLKEVLGQKYVTNMTITITNTWDYPIRIDWITMYIGNENHGSISMYIRKTKTTKEVLEPGKSREYILEFPPFNVKPGSTVEFYVGEALISSLTIK